MNGSAHSTPNVLYINLKRGPAGLGFNIVGGVDQQYVMNDSAIYVAKIKENGAAAQDARLQEGDKIIAAVFMWLDYQKKNRFYRFVQTRFKKVNGRLLENLSHSAAVQLFRTAGEDVQLCVQQRCLSQQNGPFGSQSDGDSSSSFNTQTMITLVATAALATVVGILVYKRLRGPRSPF